MARPFPVFAQNTPIGADAAHVLFVHLHTTPTQNDLNALVTRIHTICTRNQQPWILWVPNLPHTHQPPLDLLYHLNTHHNVPVMASVHDHTSCANAADLVDVLTLDAHSDEALLRTAAAFGRVIALHARTPADAARARDLLLDEGNAQIIVVVNADDLDKDWQSLGMPIVAHGTTTTLQGTHGTTVSMPTTITTLALEMLLDIKAIPSHHAHTFQG